MTLEATLEATLEPKAKPKQNSLNLPLKVEDVQLLTKLAAREHRTRTEQISYLVAKHVQEQYPNGLD